MRAREEKRREGGEGSLLSNQSQLGMTGLVTDMQTLESKFNFRMKLYELREERKIKASTFANLVSGVLYESRFGPWFVEPIVCGLEDKVRLFLFSLHHHSLKRLF